MPTIVKLVIDSDQWMDAPPGTAHQFHKVFHTLEDAFAGIALFATTALTDEEEN